MDTSSKTPKEIGNIGETVAAAYLSRHGFRVIQRNLSRKTGELDIIAKRKNTLHFVEVKTIVVNEFPDGDDTDDTYTPAQNLHASKILKVARTGEWYVLETDWSGDWQVDGALVWMRKRDGRCLVRYLPQIA